MRWLLLSVLFLFAGFQAWSNPSKTWSLKILKSQDTELQSIKTLKDGFVAVGITEKNNIYRAVIVKLSKNGKIKWIRQFSKRRDTHFSNVLVLGKKIIAVGDDYNTKSRYPVAWIVVFNQKGKILKQIKLKRKLAEGISSITETLDGGFAVSGYSFYTPKLCDGFVAKFNPDMKMEWKKVIHKKGCNEFFAITQIKDGTLIAAGYMHPPKSVASSGWLLAFGADGKKEWEKSFGDRNEETFYGITATEDGGFLVAGSKYLQDRWDDAWIIKMNRKGCVKWQKTFGFDSLDEARDAIETENGYIVAAYTYTKDGINGMGWILTLDKKGNLAGDEIIGSGFESKLLKIDRAEDGFIGSGFVSNKNGKYGWIVRLKTDKPDRSIIADEAETGLLGTR